MIHDLDSRWLPNDEVSRGIEHARDPQPLPCHYPRAKNNRKGSQTNCHMLERIFANMYAENPRTGVVEGVLVEEWMVSGLWRMVGCCLAM